jgi:hypothetical protein
MRLWRAKNPDKLKEYNRRRAPKEKEYRQARLSQYAEYQRKSRREKVRMHMLIDARYRAKRDGLPFSITEADIDWVTHCPVLSIELVYVRGEGHGRRHDAATLDRRVNDLGYVPGNVFVISHQANRMKSDATVEELCALAEYAKGEPHV